jgi:hypothetical protein
LKILKNRRDKLMTLAEAMPSEAEDKTAEELRELNEEGLYIKNCGAEYGPDADELNNRTYCIGKSPRSPGRGQRSSNRSCGKINGSEAGSTAGGRPCRQWQKVTIDRRPLSNQEWDRLEGRWPPGCGEVSLWIGRDHPPAEQSLPAARAIVTCFSGLGKKELVTKNKNAWDQGGHGLDEANKT